MSDDEETFCDWCDKPVKRRSLIMGFNPCREEFRFAKGDLICAGCLKGEKPDLYTIRYSGRQMFASVAYYEKHWKDDPKAKVLREPATMTNKTKDVTGTKHKRDSDDKVTTAATSKKNKAK